MYYLENLNARHALCTIYNNFYIQSNMFLSSQSRDRAEMISEGRWPLNTGKFTLFIFIWDHNNINLVADGCLTEVTAKVSSTVHNPAWQTWPVTQQEHKPD